MKTIFKKGFTLVQIIIVIAVIVVLAATSVGVYFGVVETSKNSKSEQEAKYIFNEIILNTIQPLKVKDIESQVSLTNEELVFEGIYDDISLDRFKKSLNINDELYDFIPAKNIDEVEEISNKNRVVFFAEKTEDFVAKVNYVGYIPATFSKKYIKYLDFETREFCNYKEGNYSLDNLPSSYVKDYLTTKTFSDINNEVLDLQHYGTSSLNAEYIGYGKVQNSNFLFEYDDVVGNSDAFRSGIYTKKSAGLIKYLAIDFNEEDELYKEKVLNVNTSINKSYANAYKSLINIISPYETQFEVPGNISFYDFSFEEFFYLRLFNFESDVLVNRFVIYYDSSAQVPDSSINEIKLNREKLFLERDSSFKLTAQIDPQEYEKEGFNFESLDESIARVSSDGLITTLDKEGSTRIRVTSKTNPFFKTYCDLHVTKNEKSFSAGLINNADLFDEENKIIVVSNNKALSSLKRNFASSFDFTNDNFLEERSVLKFDELNDILIFNFEKVEVPDDLKDQYQQLFSISIDINGVKKYITVHPYRKGDRKIYLSDDYINDGIYNGIYNVRFNNDRAYVNAINFGRSLVYDDILNVFGFGNFKTSSFTINLYRLDFENTDKSITSFKIKFPDQNSCYRYVGEEFNVVVDLSTIQPTYADPNFKIEYSLGEYDGTISIDQNGRVKVLKEGGDIIIATCADKPEVKAYLIVKAINESEKTSDNYYKIFKDNEIEEGNYLIHSQYNKVDRILCVNNEQSINDLDTSKTVEVSNNSISSNYSENSVVTIERYLDGYSIKINNQYLKDTSGFYGIKTSDTLTEDCVNYITFDGDGSIVVKGYNGNNLVYLVNGNRFVYRSSKSTIERSGINLFKYIA